MDGESRFPLCPQAKQMQTPPVQSPLRPVSILRKLDLGALTQISFLFVWDGCPPKSYELLRKSAPQFLVVGILGREPDCTKRTTRAASAPLPPRR
eukprot:7878298-Heterocapsa_arctica.AAC.1